MTSRVRISAKLFLVATSIGLLLACERPASAQAARPEGAGLRNLDEVVVTARRRAERAQDVPISLTVRSGQILQQMQATEISSLAKITPSLVMVRTGAFTQPFLRGVGKRSTLGVENSVSTYVDGVYLASSISALLDLRGVERIEVLNGPQGTLFGRNSTGGVIQVITRDPEPGRAAEAELHLGSRGYVRGDGYVSGHAERVAANLAVSLSRNDGYGTNLFSGRSDQGQVDHSLVARSKWVWRPTAGMALTLAADYQDVDQDFSQRPVSGFPAVGAPGVQGFRDGDQDASNRYHFRYGGASVRADGQLGTVSLLSLSAVRNMHAQYSADLDQGPQPLLAGSPTARQMQWSQEFQLQSRASAHVQWLAGFYYIRLDEEYRPSSFRYGGSYSAQRGGRISQTLSDIGVVSSYAAYGQTTVPIAARTRLTTGVRYTLENRSVRAAGQQIYDNPPFVRPVPGLPLLTDPPLRNSDSLRQLTWRASLDRDFSRMLMGYFSISRGFQSGGWNLQTPQSPAFGPETLTAFEVGVKLVDPLRRLRVDASAFHYNYTDLQVSAFTAVGSVTTNAASAAVDGVDLELEAQLDAATGILVGAQLLEARFNRFANASCINYATDAAVLYAPMSCDVTGNRLPFAPRLKLNIGANHRVQLGRLGALLLSGNLAGNSGYFSEVDNVVRQRRYVTVDASAEWRGPSRGPTVRVWTRNLTNSRYYDSLVTFPTAGVLQRPAAPRQFGVSIGQTF